MLPVPPRYSLGLALFAILAGCATPQYQTTVRLIPPADERGRVCVQDCESQKTVCQADCKTRYQSCARDIEPQVEPRYADALKQYENDLKHYAVALRQYEMQLRFDWLHSHPYHHPYWWNPWPRPYYPFPYSEPVMPTRESVREKLERTNCQTDCGCVPTYEACFVGCGGQRLSETLCIKNCPATK